MAKIKQSNYIACWNLLNIGFIKTRYELRNREVAIQYWLITYHFDSNFVPLTLSAFPKWSFSIKYRRNGSLLVSFIKLLDFMILQLVNKRTEIVPLATSHIAVAHFCNQFNYVFAQLISVPRFKKHWFLSKFRPKIQSFLQEKEYKFSSAGGSASAYCDWRRCSPTSSLRRMWALPQTSETPLFVHFWLRA